MTAKNESDRGRWHHPGGKLKRMGPARCSNTELLAILIGSGLPGCSAEQIAEDLIIRFRSLGEVSKQPLERLMQIRGVKQVKAIRIMAAFELARRLSSNGSLTH